MIGTSVRAQIAIRRNRATNQRTPDLQRAVRDSPAYERAVRKLSKMFAEAGIRYALAGALAANTYRDGTCAMHNIEFLVGDEAFETHPGGYVTMRVPVIEFEGIEIDQVPLTDALRVVEDGLNHAAVSDGVPIASLETVVLMKLLAGRTQDLADIEAIIESGVDREQLRSTIQRALPDRLDTLERLFQNADRTRR